ncbi:hypothetical protein [Streptomyces griseoluteus]|uniref:hypothetical protein n=1 Tax=Streptomyces griseoluteus TaxID=29306 RepID=UPI0016775E85|nr:hypothetical protein [Streptomyces griseoluteus]GHF25402.1 hypothetical protein GCM10017776_49790 [Streptomyces griseoluteus]
MGSLRLTLCSGIIAATAFTPAVAHAADGGGTHGAGGLTVAPAVPLPGTDVSLRVRGCTASQGTAVSSAFVSDARLTGGQGDLSGETRVRTSLKAGTYDVRITCADYSFTSRISVDAAGPGTRPDADSGSGPVTGLSPVAPVLAGGGGTASGADTSTLFATVAPTGSGPGAAQALTGLALAGCTAVTVGALRSRRSRNDG